MRSASLAALKNELASKKKAIEDVQKSSGNKTRWITRAQYDQAQAAPGTTEREHRASKRAELMEKIQRESSPRSPTHHNHQQQEQEQEQEKHAEQNEQQKGGASISEAEPESSLENVVFKLPAKEVMRRLRLRNKPITLFGEDDRMRAERLKALEESEPMEYDSASGGSGNEMHKLLRTMSLKYNVKLIHVCGMKDYDDDDSDKRKRKGEDDDNDNEGEDDEKEEEEGTQGQPAAKRKKNEDALLSLKTGSFEDSKDDQPNTKIYKFFKRLLKEWYAVVSNEDGSARKTQASIKELFAFNQCVNAMEPLFKMLMEGGLPEDIFIHISIIVDKLKERKYIEADEEYLRMAIGNAPWPMGVTNVGIHDRVAREKISMNQVARK